MADEDTDSITIDDTEYTLSREITGEQFMELRRRSITVKTNGVSEESNIDFSSVDYDFWNLAYRLKSPELTPAQIKALPRRVFMALTLMAGRLDAEEARTITDFLQQHSQAFQVSPLISEPSSGFPQSILEVISDKPQD